MKSQENAENYRSTDVWAAMGRPAGEAQELRLRTDMMIALTTFLENKKLRKPSAAKLLGVTETRLTHLLKGKINEFSLKDLVNLLAKAGLRADVTIHTAA